MSETAPDRRLGRAAEKGLTRDAIVSAAIALIDAEGLGNFSVRALARQLGVYPAAIYWHIGGAKDDLFSEITATITAGLIRPDEVPDDWRDTLRLVFHRYRAAARKHPDIANLIGAQIKSNGPPHAGLVEVLITALRRAGYDGETLVDAFNALIGGLFGYVTMELAPPPQRDVAAWETSFESRLSALDPARFPETAAYLPLMRNRAFALRWKNGVEVPLAGGYDALIENLIAGLAANAPKPVTPSPAKEQSP